MTRILHLALAVLVAAGCPALIGPDWRAEVGTIRLGGPQPVPALVVRDTVDAGEAFTARVATFGSTGCIRPAGAEVEAEGNTAEITPYDMVAPEGTVCTRDLRAFPREVTLKFDAPGEAIIRVRGRGPGGAMVQVEERVVVRR